MTDDLAAWRVELAGIEKKVGREFATQGRGGAVAACAALTALALALPATPYATGWEALTGDTATPAHALTRVFLALAAGAGVGLTAAALFTRRWALAWAAMATTGLGAVFGMLAVWSELAPDPDPHAPRAGLLLAWAAMAALSYQWLRLAASRSNLMPPR